jgi:hypothetical protein
MKNAEVMREVPKGYRLPAPPGATEAVYQIMQQCWNDDAKKRPAFSDLSESLAPHAIGTTDYAASAVPPPPPRSLNNPTVGVGGNSDDGGGVGDLHETSFTGAGSSYLDVEPKSFEEGDYLIPVSPAAAQHAASFAVMAAKEHAGLAETKVVGACAVDFKDNSAAVASAARITAARQQADVLLINMGTNSTFSI